MQKAFQIAKIQHNVLEKKDRKEHTKAKGIDRRFEETRIFITCNMGTRPTVISTFAGCGGSTLGYKMAGYNELLAIDFDATCEKTFNTNFPETPFWKKDIVSVETKEILSFTKLKVGELDLLDGSPPCQGFSISGNRDINDARNKLFLEFVRLIDGLKPKVFVMENVSGLSYGKMKGIFNEIMKCFSDLKYITKCKMLDAKYHGVPQSRRRLIWIGVRNDIGKEPEFPDINNGIISVNKALNGLVITEQIKVPCNAVRKRVLDRCIEGEGGDKYNKGMYFNWVRISRRKPCPTISKTAMLLHWKDDRYLTIQELKRLSTFPDDFVFAGNFFSQWGQIGNSVPPKMIEAIAETIKQKILLNR